MSRTWARPFSSAPTTRRSRARSRRWCRATFVGLAPGRQRYTQLTDDNGGILDDLMVTRSADPAEDGVLLLVVNAAIKEADYAHIAARLPAGVRLLRADHRALIAVQGPSALRAVGRHCPDVVPMPFMSAITTRFDGIDCHISRSGYTGEDGFEISCKATRVRAIVERLLSEPSVKLIGLGARDSLRLEAGLCLYGHDIDTTTSPVEAAIAWSIGKRRREEGGFPGAERIQRELREGAGAQARRHQAGGARAGARGHRDPRRRGRADRQGDLGRLRAERERPGRDGLRRDEVRRARHGGDAAGARQAAAGERRRAAVRAASLRPDLKGSDMTTRYTKDHEWIRLDGEVATVGISEHAQSQLGDIVYVELPEIGREVEKGGEAAVVESVKAASDVYAPVSGQVVAINESLDGAPATINEDAEGKGWFFRLKLANPDQLDELMSAEQYKEYLATLE